MNLLFYSSYFKPYQSGLTNYADTLLTNLSKKHVVTLLTFNHTKELPPYEKMGGIHIKRMPFLFSIAKGFISPQSLLTFIKEVKSADVVLINLPNVEAVPLAILAKLYNKKCITLFQCEIDVGKGIVPYLIENILTCAMYIQLLCSSHIVAFPDYVEHSSIYEKFKHKIYTSLPPVLAPLIDLEEVTIMKEKKKDEIWVGFLGRVAKEKGVQYLIEAMKEVIKLFPTARLVFAGPYGPDVAGEQSYYEYIKKTLDAQKTPYTFLGKLTDQQKGAFLSTIDLLVLPSINRTEAFGMVQAEAMLCGTPVVASNLPGVRLPIRMTHMGLIAKQADPASLASSIKTVLRHRADYTNALLQKKAQSLFQSKSVFTFYDSLLSK